MVETMVEDRSHRNVGFVEAFSLYFRNYFRFSGRSSRGAYWFWIVWLIVVGLVLSAVDYAVFGTQEGLFQGVWSLLTIIPGIALNCRRLHDINRSGWWQLLFITVIGIILLIFWYCQPGQPRTNDYGADEEAGKD